MKKIMGLTIIALCFLIVTFVTSAQAGQKEPVLQKEVGFGQEFFITLDSNPTTGYSWQIDGALDETKVQLVGNVFQAPQTDLVGAPGQEIWTLKAVGRGQAAISFQYVRPWEKGVPPVEKKKILILIK